MPRDKWLKIIFFVNIWDEMVIEELSFKQRVSLKSDRTRVRSTSEAVLRKFLFANTSPWCSCRDAANLRRYCLPRMKRWKCESCVWAKKMWKFKLRMCLEKEGWICLLRLNKFKKTDGVVWNRKFRGDRVWIEIVEVKKVPAEERCKAMIAFEYMNSKIMWIKLKFVRVKLCVVVVYGMCKERRANKKDGVRNGWIRIVQEYYTKNCWLGFW